MIRRHTFVLAALVASGALFTGCAAVPTRDHVVIQVSDNDPSKWNLALNNAKNVQDAAGGADKVDVEIVAYGPGIGMLKGDATVANRVSAAVQSGVQVAACENTMRGQKLTPADMNPSISYVPAGVMEIMKRQKEGWGYIRP